MIAELTIDLGAIRRNVERLGEFIGPARYAAVVKSNAYGHGLVPVARALEPSVAMLCVFGAAEALTLREAGVALPLLVLGPVEHRDLAELVRRDVAFALWSDGAFVRDVARAARTAGTRARAHAKIDTGVTRLGLDAPVAAGTIAGYLALSDIELAGVFTHLAAAEELESAYTLGQLERFEGALTPIAALLSERRVMRHAAASAAAMLYPKLRLDVVRAGIATYGIWPSPSTYDAVSERLTLEPALSWTTSVAVVRAVEAGRAVGYGCAFVTDRASRIGVIPIGYAEGVPRSLSNRGSVIVAGRRAPIVGRICMNMTFVDLTGIDDAGAGARVTLIGRDGDETIDANELAAAAGTIGYEIVARLPADIPRRYVTHTVTPSESA